MNEKIFWLIGEMKVIPLEKGITSSLNMDYHHFSRTIDDIINMDIFSYPDIIYFNTLGVSDVMVSAALHALEKAYNHSGKDIEVSFCGEDMSMVYRACENIVHNQ